MSSPGRHRLAGSAHQAGDATSDADGRRVDWVDSGRGVAIVLVVLVHSRDWLETAGFDTSHWEQVNDVLSGLRMPLFFTISGVLGASSITTAWSQLLPRKVTPLVWVYLAWQPIGLAAALLADRFTGAQQNGLHFLLALTATTIRPRSELWFLWALAVYFVLARATSHTPRWIQLLVSGAVSAVWLSGLVPEGNLGWNGVPKYYAFFLLGAYHRPVILWAADRIRRLPRVTAALITGWAVTAVAAEATGVDRLVGPGLLVRIIALPAGIALAGLLARSRAARYLGAHTLPIYLAHTPLIILAAWIIRREPAAWTRPEAPLLPLALTALVVPLTLALHFLLRPGPGRVLYLPPAKVTGLVARVCLAQTATVSHRP